MNSGLSPEVGWSTKNGWAESVDEGARAFADDVGLEAGAFHQRAKQDRQQ